MPDVTNLTIAPRTLATRLIVKLWRPSKADIKLLASMLAVVLPQKPMQFLDRKEGRVYALAPGDWVLENVLSLPDAEERLAGLSAIWSVVDVAHGRASVSITGTGTADLINSGCSVDLHPRSFAVGDCAETLLAGTHLMIARVAPDRIRSHLRPRG